jgi:dihydrofolate reductase
MGKVVVTEFVTLDGVAQAPGGPDEDTESGFTHGGWQAPLINDETGRAIHAQAQGLDALLLGRKTYDIFAGYWPTAPDDIPFKALLNGVPKYVVSRTLSEPLSWAGTSLLGGDLATEITELKQRHEHVHVIGSLNLVQSLLRLGLVDRLNLWQHPILLGEGKRVFDGGTVPAALKLSESVVHPNGTLQLSYDTLGEAPKYGDMTTA